MGGLKRGDSPPLPLRSLFPAPLPLDPRKKGEGGGGMCACVYTIQYIHTPMLGYNIYAYLNSWVSIAWGPNKIDSPEKMGTGEERKRGKGEGRERRVEGG